MIFINMVLIIKGKKWFINTENIKYRFFHPWYEQKHATSSHSCIITRYLTLCYTFCNTFLEFLRAQIFFVWSMYICSLDYDDMTRTFFFIADVTKHLTDETTQVWRWESYTLSKVLCFHHFLPNISKIINILFRGALKKKITTFWAYAWLQWP